MLDNSMTVTASYEKASLGFVYYAPLGLDVA